MASVIQRVACLTFIAFVLVAGAIAAEGGDVVFILDASGSMWAQMGKTTKIEVAKEVLTQQVEGLSAESRLGLVVYGHRQKGDCNDVEIVVPLAEGAGPQVVSALAAVNPKGMTPIARSIQATADILATEEESVAIVLISDGKETCDGDPCALVEQLRKQGIDLVMHVVGFDVSAEERKELECIAKAGGGSYFAAADADGLREATEQVLDSAVGPGLAVTALKNGKPLNAAIIVSQGGKVIARSSTREYNPISFHLEPGEYEIEALDGASRQKTRLKATVSVGEKPAEHTFDFSEGGFRIAVKRNGKASKAHYRVFARGESKPAFWGAVEDGQSIGVQPGTWDLEIYDKEVTNNPTFRFEGLEVVGGETIDQSVAIEQGTLTIRTFKGGANADAKIVIFNAGTQDAVAHPATTSRNNPIELQLTPGTYDIQIRDHRVKGHPSQLFPGTTVEMNGTTTLEVDLGTL